MINHLKLKFGPSRTHPALEFDVAPVTVFVGPNYSGKSKLLSEILAQCVSGQPVQSDIILDQIWFKARSEDDARLLLDNIVSPLKPGETVPFDHAFIGRGTSRGQIHVPAFLQGLQTPNEIQFRALFAQYFLQYFTLMLNGRNRVDLVNDRPGGDLQQQAQNSFQVLFKNDQLRLRLSQLVHQALGLYLTVDPTALGTLRLRLSRDPPPSLEVERGLTAASVTFHSKATHIQETSDGAKAFVGILAELLAGDPEILLLDEPEAFLHPSLAYVLGREIANTTASTEKRVFVSTHSPQFLMGCIQSGVSINVVRLTYQNGAATARLLPSNELIRLMRNPLLRSIGVISALFYESVVVTEADPDRAFYQEINERLLRANDGRGIANCIFLNAQNKQTIPTIVLPLRSLGIPTAAIYDIDVVKDGGSIATKFYTSSGIPDLLQQSLGTLRGDILRALQLKDANYKRNGGIRVLAESERNGANDFFDQLDSYGAFVVRGGELESWLKALNVPGHGPPWLISMFERMGEDPSLQGYIHPSDVDVWKFIEKVKKWLLDPGRKGIPG